MRRLAALVAFACTSSCEDETADAPAPIRETVTVEVFNLAIDGRRDTWSDERLAHASTELTDSPDDILCLTGVHGQPARDTIVSALRDPFPFSVALPTDDGTAITDPSGRDGEIPPEWDSPSCDGEELGLVASALSCMKQSCAYWGPQTSLDPLYPCFNCFEAIDVVAQLTSLRCNACFRAHVRTGATYVDTMDRCATIAGNPLGYAGDHGLLLLSRLPVKSATIEVLPSEGIRRAALRAVVETPGGRSLGITCASLGSTLLLGPADETPADEPYPGPYGSPTDGWILEHDLQIEKLVALAPPADREILLGWWGDSPGYEQDGEVLLAESGASSVERLADAFEEGIAPGYEPACTLCPDNRIAPIDMPPTWPNRIYLRGIPRERVRSTVRTHLGSVVSVEPHVLSGWVVDRVPLSVAFGVQSVIELD